MAGHNGGSDGWSHVSRSSGQYRSMCVLHKGAETALTSRREGDAFYIFKCLNTLRLRYRHIWKYMLVFSPPTDEEVTLKCFLPTPFPTSSLLPLCSPRPFTSEVVYFTFIPEQLKVNVSAVTAPEFLADDAPEELPQGEEGAVSFLF